MGVVALNQKSLMTVSSSFVTLIFFSYLFKVFCFSSISTILLSGGQRRTTCILVESLKKSEAVYKSSSTTFISMIPDNLEHDDGKVDRNSTIYRKKDVMLNVAKQALSEAYSVKLPKGMENPVLTVKEQVIADRMKQSLEEDPTKTDLDLLKEELRKIIEKMG